MGLKNKYQILLLSVIHLSVSVTFAQALLPTEVQINLVPAVNPGAKCLMDEVRVPKDIPDYQYISNSDCTAYFVLPPSINKQRIEVEPSGSLKLCDAVNFAQDTIVKIEEQKGILLDKIKALSEETPQSTAKKEQLQKEKASLRGEIAELNELLDAEQDRLYKSYGNIPGAKYSILLHSQVNPADLNLLSFENRKTIVNPTLDALGLPAEYEVRPYFKEATLENSIYSFTYYSPATRDEHSTVLSSNMPGQILLEELNGKYKTVHIKLNNSPTAELELNLIGVCHAVKKNAEGEPYLSDAGKRPIFTVNRSYSVQQQFKYGYIAKMKSDEVTEQLVKEIITSTNKGFNKKQIFENTMTANLDTVLKFEWTSNFSTEEHQYNAEKIEEIKQAVFVKFVDDYFDKLVQAGVLEIVQPTNVEEADGGYADVTKEGYACWTKRSLFSKRTHCGNYTYVVKEWFDGITDKELNDKLTINSTFTEEMQVNEMAPFYYSSTFIK